MPKVLSRRTLPTVNYELSIKNCTVPLKEILVKKIFYFRVVRPKRAFFEPPLRRKSIK